MNNVKTLKVTLGIVIIAALLLVGYTTHKYNSIVRDSKQFTEDLANSPDDASARATLAAYVKRVDNEGIALSSHAYKWWNARQSTNVEDRRTNTIDHSCGWYRSYLGNCN